MAFSVNLHKLKTMNYILFDDRRVNFLPFSYTRPVAEIRIGILSISEKWKKHLNAEISYLTEAYLQQKFQVNYDSDNLFINACALPDKKLIEAIHQLGEGDLLYHQSEEMIIAFRSSQKVDWHELDHYGFNQINYKEDFLNIKENWDIFSKNGEALKRDFELICKGRKSANIDEHSTLIGSDIFIEEGAKINACILNTSTGPIYIGKDAEVMEGSVIRGPFSLGEGAVVKLAAKIYGPTTIGPHCKVGGEVNNSILFGYSNKGHDGFLGNSVIGEWCNLGADTNVSNLKNNYAEIKIWSYEKQGFKNTGLQFCGLMMGDHSKSGINTMFNTATVVGVSANIYGAGFPRNFVPSFSWGGAEKWVEFRTNKAFEVSERMMERRSVPFSDEDKAILEHVFEQTRAYRNF